MCNFIFLFFHSFSIQFKAIRQDLKRTLKKKEEPRMKTKPQKIEYFKIENGLDVVQLGY